MSDNHETLATDAEIDEQIELATLLAEEIQALDEGPYAADILDIFATWDLCLVRDTETAFPAYVRLVGDGWIHPPEDYFDD